MLVDVVMSFATIVTPSAWIFSGIVNTGSCEVSRQRRDARPARRGHHPDRAVHEHPAAGAAERAQRDARPRQPDHATVLVVAGRQAADLAAPQRAREPGEGGVRRLAAAVRGARRARRGIEVAVRAGARAGTGAVVAVAVRGAAAAGQRQVADQGGDDRERPTTHTSPAAGKPRAGLVERTSLKVCDAYGVVGRWVRRRSPRPRASRIPPAAASTPRSAPVNGRLPPSSVAAAVGPPVSSPPPCSRPATTLEPPYPSLPDCAYTAGAESASNAVAPTTARSFLERIIGPANSLSRFHLDPD